jgi:hypothetical protein
MGRSVKAAMIDTSKVVPFPSEDEKLIQRQLDEVERLARLAPGEYLLWLSKSAERIGMAPADLKGAVEAKIKERRALETQEQRQIREEDRRAVEREKQETRDARQAQNEERFQERKRVKRYEAFAEWQPLSPQEQEAQLVLWGKANGYADKLDELRDEFKEFMADAATADDAAAGAHISSKPLWGRIEPWPEPVDGAVLFTDIEIFFKKYLVFNSGNMGRDPKLAEAQATASVLFGVQSHLHEQLASISPILAVTAPLSKSGKTTLLELVAAMSWRPTLNVRLTGPQLYRTVDRDKPTLVIDEADQMFEHRRSSDLVEIVNASHRKGYKIPIDPHDYDPFCPKMLGLKGMEHVPEATTTRFITIKLVRKRRDELTVGKFRFQKHWNLPEVLELRRKLARWLADNTKAVADRLNQIEQRSPDVPLPEIDDRVLDNWELNLAIVDVARGDWPRRAREAMQKLAEEETNVSWLEQVAAGMHDFICASKRTKEDDAIATAEVVKWLTRDEGSEFRHFKHGRPITQHQISRMIRQAHGLAAHVVHPTHRSNYSPSGYEVRELVDFFERVLGKTLELSH